jgi:hypothetical protein
MAANAAIELPSFDTGQFEGCELAMANGGATLSVHIAGRQPFLIRFGKVRWHQFTAAPNCTAEMIDGAYFRMAENLHSNAVRDFVGQEQTAQKPYSRLSHYRIFLDEAGCHEFFAESAVTL